MPSVQSHLMSWVLWFTGKRICSSAENLRKAVDNDRRTRDPAPPKKLQSKLNIDEKQQSGQTVYTLAPKSDSPTKATLLYLHGGGFIFDMTPEHWGLVAALTESLNATVVVPIYPLAPETKLLAIYEAVGPIYNELAAAATPTKPFWCGGDSAGGSMTVVLTRQGLDADQPTASKLLLISPALDYSLANPDLHAAAKSDPWLDVPAVKEMANLVCPDLATNDPRLSPIYGELGGLPPMLILAGGADLLTPDTRIFAEKAREKGVDVEFFFAKGMMHIWPVMPIPEAKVAIAKMTEWLLQSSDKS
jgi:acetyl esterase/lipase